MPGRFLSVEDHALRAALSPYLTGTWALIGLGNPDRADDGAGIVTARMVQTRFPGRAFAETEMPVESILDRLPDGCDTVLFVDAADFGGRAGEIRLFQSDGLDAFQPAVSTHRVPLGFWFGYLSSRQIRPILAGIQPADLTWMGKMSAVVASASGMLGRVLCLGFESCGGVASENS